MTPGLWAYLAAWSLFCGAALLGLIATPRRYSITSRAYWRFLGARWKLLTFAVAAGCFVVIAPYTGDPTWDYVDAFFMSALTFATAPWAVATLYFAVRDRKINRQTLLAVCLWMFSASWSYDLYLLLRDGYYPNTWLPNIFASSLLYACAGLFWNLDWRAGRGATFAFLEQDWLAAEQGSFWRIIGFALPFMLIVAATLLYFLV